MILIVWQSRPHVTVDLSDRDNKENLFVKEEVTNDAEVFGEVVVDVEGPQKEPSSSVLLLVSTALSFSNFNQRFQ